MKLTNSWRNLEQRRSRPASIITTGGVFVGVDLVAPVFVGRWPNDMFHYMFLKIVDVFKCVTSRICYAGDKKIVFFYFGLI